MSLGYSAVIWVRNKYRVLFWGNGNNYQNTTFRQQFIFLSSFKFPQVPTHTPDTSIQEGEPAESNCHRHFCWCLAEAHTCWGDVSCKYYNRGSVFTSVITIGSSHRWKGVRESSRNSLECLEDSRKTQPHPRKVPKSRSTGQVPKGGTMHDAF